MREHGSLIAYRYEAPNRRGEEIRGAAPEPLGACRAGPSLSFRARDPRGRIIRVHVTIATGTAENVIDQYK